MEGLREGHVVRVNLKNGWFGPDGGFFAVRDNPHVFVDDWADKLPKSAVIVAEEVTEAEADAEETAKAALAKKLGEMSFEQLQEYADDNSIIYDDDVERAALIETILAG